METKIFKLDEITDKKLDHVNYIHIRNGGPSPSMEDIVMNGIEKTVPIFTFIDREGDVQQYAFLDEDLSNIIQDLQDTIKRKDVIISDLEADKRKVISAVKEFIDDSKEIAGQ